MWTRFSEGERMGGLTLYNSHRRDLLAAALGSRS